MKALVAAILMSFSPFALVAEPLVMAAASLKGPLDRVFEGRDVRVAYAGSGLIARQVAAGAPADLVILANDLWMDWLIDEGRVAPEAPRDLMSNRLVVVGPEGSEPLDLTEEAILARLGSGRLAVGNLRSVPAGLYAGEALEALGLLATLGGRLAEVENVRVALALVARGEAPLGIVYATDAQAEEGVEVVADIPADLHAPIRYLAAPLTDDANVLALLERLQGPEAQAIFAEAGFLPTAEGEP